jgi:hypothetical protein
MRQVFGTGYREEEMFEVIVILLLLYLIWTFEANARVIVSNQKEIGKELEKLGAKNTEQQVQPDNADNPVIATFYVSGDEIK